MTESEIEGTTDLDVMEQNPRRHFVQYLIEAVRERDAHIAHLQKQLNEATDRDVARRWAESAMITRRKAAQNSPANPELKGNEH